MKPYVFKKDFVWNYGTDFKATAGTRLFLQGDKYVYKDTEGREHWFAKELVEKDKEYFRPVNMLEQVFHIFQTNG